VRSSVSGGRCLVKLTANRIAESVLKILLTVKIACDFLQFLQASNEEVWHGIFEFT